MCFPIVTHAHLRKKARAKAIIGPAVITAGKRDRRPKPEPEVDPEAEARVKAYFTRMMRPPGTDD
jgi:hypothetical protein